MSKQDRLDEILESYFERRTKALRRHMNQHRKDPEHTAVDDSIRDITINSKQALEAYIEEEVRKARIKDYRQLAWMAMKEDTHGFRTGDIGTEVMRRLRESDKNYDIHWLYSIQERANGKAKLKSNTEDKHE